MTDNAALAQTHANAVNSSAPGAPGGKSDAVQSAGPPTADADAGAGAGAGAGADAGVDKGNTDTDTTTTTTKTNDNDDDEDEWDARIRRSGCYAQHVALQDCYWEAKDWRACRAEMRAFKECFGQTRQ